MLLREILPRILLSTHIEEDFATGARIRAIHGPRHSHRLSPLQILAKVTRVNGTTSFLPPTGEPSKCYVTLQSPGYCQRAQVIFRFDGTFRLTSIYSIYWVDEYIYSRITLPVSCYSFIFFSLISFVTNDHSKEHANRLFKFQRWIFMCAFYQFTIYRD